MGCGRRRALLWRDTGTVGSGGLDEERPQSAAGPGAGPRPAAIFAGWAPCPGLPPALGAGRRGGRSRLLFSASRRVE